MTADDPDSTTGPRPLILLERPDGGWQVGVGPGAVVLHAGPDGPDGSAGDVLGPALASLAEAERELSCRDEPAACAVLGTGPLAARLRRVLGARSATTGRVQVLVHQHVVPPEVGVTVARGGRPTLPVVAQRLRVLVGPVVGVGDGPCLHCLDLHRRDRDAAWPALASALGHPAEQQVPLDLPEPVVRAAEGLVMLLVASVVAGRAVATGLGYELGPAAPHVVARRWLRHPGCPWHF